MKCSLSLYTLLALSVTVASLSSCDSGGGTTSSDSPSSTDTVSTPAGTVVAPVFSPAGGTYSAAQSVTLSSATSGATIYYTTDGSTPTTASTRYSSPVTVSASKTLKSIAVKSGLATSSVSAVSYTISTGGSGTTIPWNSSITYGNLTDTRDGQNYKTVTIGTQTWMAENLNYNLDSSWWYENSADSGAKYGRLYQWAAVMGLDASYNGKLWSGTLPHQGICPSGWHVPSDAEWYAFEDYVRGNSAAGKRLQSTIGWIRYGESVNGTDNYGFRLLPAGRRNLDGSFGHVGSYAFFWSSSELVADEARYHYLYSGGIDLVGDYYFKKYGYSVRCLKDGP